MEDMERLTGKRILVTGGSGFVGSHVVESLLAIKAKVIIPVRSFEPDSYFHQKSFFSTTVLALCDLKDKNRVMDIIAKYEIEYIIHLGAQPIVSTAYVNPSETLETNIMGTVNILEAMRLTSGVKGMVLASSDKAYGKSDKPYKETDALRGDHPYEVSKSASDLIATSYMKTYNLPIIITRFGNIYGPGDLNFNRIIPGIMKSIFTKSILEIRSNGKYRREYVYVDDVVSAYMFLLNNFTKAKNQAYNISSKERYSVLDVIKICKRMFKNSLEFNILDTAVNEIPEQSLNCQKIHALGWKSSYSLEKGLKESSRWYEAYFSKA
jgi:CDP-glucose 4,6-dehydratase